ncbi:hypothetical protein [Clostridium tagluense]|uniref:hypothetical protein n=1 Tax=Clostridium tagluense TaxID=360422 RepID=UPI001CF36057|nr:hypothetical protein [Clostridium tagluense]MCB2297042.1 hypothetical protein [Clostridium tagluense]
MFDDTIVKILGSSYINTPIKTLMSDVQDYTSTIEKENYAYKCTKIIVCEIEPLMQRNFYLNIDNKIYKIIKVDICSEHMEVYLFLMDFKNIKIDGIDNKVLIEEVTEKITYKDEKIIISDFEISTGTIVEYKNYKWFVTSQVAEDSDSYRSRITKVEQSFKMYIDSVLEEVPTIIEVQTQGLDENQYITSAKGNIKLNVQDNLITKKITYDNRILMMGSAWKITGFTTENKGICYFYLEKDEFNQYDNKELEIADFYKHQHTYKINILNIPTSNLTQTLNLTTITPPIQLEVQVTDEDNKILSNPILTFTSSNPNIISISNTGLITPITSGNCTLTVKFNDTIKIINIIVESLPIVDNLSISILGESTTYMNMDEIYNVLVMNNGIEVNGKNVDWSINDITFAKIVSKNGMNCNLKMNMKNKFGIFKLKCWMIDDISVFVEKEIRISRM